MNTKENCDLWMNYVYAEWLDGFVKKVTTHKSARLYKKHGRAYESRAALRKNRGSVEFIGAIEKI